MQTSPIIVTGMHRSGTSFVASLLLTAGIHMGDRLMDAGTGNPRGHFENLDFVEFQEGILRSTGRDEAGLVDVGSGPLAPENFDDTIYAEALALIAKNARETPWGWKDPRCTLMLDFWNRVAPGAFYVLLYREPAEVIDSLFRRGDVTIKNMPEEAARTWLSYNGILLRFARMNRTRCILANSAVVGRNPQAFLSMVASRFGMKVNADAPSPFDPDLMHQMSADGAEPILLRYLVPEMERLFVDLEGEADLAAGVYRDSPVSPKRARAVFLGDWAEARRIENTKLHDAQLTDVEKLLAERERELAETRGYLSTAEMEMRRAQTAFQEQAPRLAAASEQLLGAQSTAHATQLELVRAQEQLFATRSERDGILNRLEESLAKIASGTAHLNDLDERFRHALLEIATSAEQLRFAEREREALTRQLEEALAKLVSREARIDELGERFRQAELEIARGSERLRHAEHERDVFSQRVDKEREDIQLRLEETLTALATQGKHVSEVTEQLHASTLQFARSAEQLRFAEIERDSFAERTVTLQREIAASAERTKALENRVVELTKSEAELNAARELLRVVQQERDELAERTEKLHSEVTTLARSTVEAEAAQGHLRKMQHDLEELGTQVKLADKVAADALDRIHTLEARNSELTGRAHAAADEAAAVRSELLGWLDQLEVVTKALATERANSAAKDADLESLREGHIAEIKHSQERLVAESRAQLESLREQFDSERARLSREHQDETTTLRKRAAEMSAALGVLNDTLRGLRERESSTKIELEELRASHKVLSKALDETSSRFLQHLEVSLSQTREEAQQIAALIDEVQSSRFWKIKRALGRLLGRGDTRR